MSIAECVCNLLNINLKKISRSESIVLEAELLSRIYQELREFFREKYKDYFQLMKFTVEMENDMLDKNLINNLVKDILITGDYSIAGIAYYTNTFEEVIDDIAAGRNIYPSFPLGRRIIELHRTVRPNLYHEIMKKIANEYFM